MSYRSMITKGCRGWEGANVRGKCHDIRGTELICVVEQDQIWACGTVARKTDRVIQHRLRLRVRKCDSNPLKGNLYNADWQSR